MRRTWIALLALAATGFVACGAASQQSESPSAPPPAPAAAASASVAVDASRALGRIEPRLFGANVDFNWNGNGLLMETGEPFPQLLEAASALAITSLRGPGGSYADSYDWRKGVGPNRHGYGAEYGFGSAEFLSLLSRLGAEGLLTANFASGDPALLGGWVQQIAKSGDRVLTWEIGNEIYGDWEKGHTDAATYARRFREFASAARAASPKARLALVVAPTMQGGGQDYAGWNELVLPAAGPAADVASVHLYSPWHDFFGSASADTSRAVMAAPELWSKELARLRAALRAVPGASGKPLELWVTEWNTQHGDDHDWKQRGVTLEESVFVADMLRVFVEQDVDAAQFYNLFGSYWGLFDRQGATDDLRSMLRLRMPPKREIADFRLVRRPAAHVFDLYRPLREGTRVAHVVQSQTFSSRKYGSVPAQTDVPTLRALAVREKGDAGLSIVLINRSLDARLETRVTIAGWNGARNAQLLVLGGSALSDSNEDGSDRVRPVEQPVRNEDGGFVVALPPHSVGRLRLGSAPGGRLALAP